MPHCTFLGGLDLVSSSSGTDLSGMSNEAQDTVPATIVYGGIAYNDLFHKKTLYTDRDPSLKDVTIAESPYSSLSLLFRRPHWGIAPSLCLTRTYVRAESVPGNYDLTLQQNRDNAGIALWGDLLGLRAGVRMRYLPVSHDVNTLFHLGWRSDHVTAGIYAATSTLAHLKMIVTQAGAPLSVSLHALCDEAGGIASFKTRFVSARLHVCGLAIRSDTAGTGISSLATVLDGGGRMIDGLARADSLPAAPRISFCASTLSWKAAGYDGGNRYATIDTCDFSAYGGEASVAPVWRIRAGVFIEMVDSRNKNHGLFDPFPFSSLTFFKQDKYRIDSLRALVNNWGFFLSRDFPFLSRHCVSLDAAVSHCVIAASADTRTYDFTYLLPRLINPQKYRLADKELYLVRLSLGYAFTWGNLTANLGATQYVPVEKQAVSSHPQGAAPPSNEKTTMYGGTLYSASLSYGF